MSVKLDRSLLHLRNLRLPLCQIGGRLSPHVDLIDTHDESVIDVVDSPRSVISSPSGLCDCVAISYAARPVSRQDVNKLRIDDSRLQSVDSTLRPGGSSISSVYRRVEGQYRRFETSNRRSEVCHSGM
jgi:hypothetical protein